MANSNKIGRSARVLRVGTWRWRQVLWSHFHGKPNVASYPFRNYQQLYNKAIELLVTWHPFHVSHRSDMPHMTPTIKKIGTWQWRLLGGGLPPQQETWQPYIQRKLIPGVLLLEHLWAKYSRRALVRSSKQLEWIISRQLWDGWEANLKQIYSELISISFLGAYSRESIVRSTALINVFLKTQK